MPDLDRYDNGWGRMVIRPKRDTQPVARSDVFSVPHVISDTISPAVSPADGKTYTSLSALRRSYRGDGNPQGVAFQEVPEFNPDTYKPPEPKGISMQEAKDVTERAMAAVSRGEPAHSFQLNPE